MIATNIEQSKHLLGLPAETADMVWRNYAAGGYRLEVLHKEIFETIGENDIPAWSLSALLEVMPKYIMKDGVECNIEFWTEGLAGSRWVIGYVGWSRQGQKHIKLVRTTFCKAVGQNLNTAAYEMVCWLLENGHIKKGGRQ